jgi:precorrin-3B synthase
MNPLRRNACPTIAAPMETGDGLLARLPPTGPLPPATLRAVCDAAPAFGNGLVEITARGSLQVRGLAAGTVAPFAAALAEAGIGDAAPAILAPPLAGLDPEEIADVRPLVRDLRAAIAAVGIGPRLAPKTSVVIDGGGSLHLDGIDADLRLVALDDARFHLVLGGPAATAAPVGAIARDRAVDAALAVLGRLADAGPTARGRDLDAATIAAAIGAVPTPPPTPRRQAEPVGVHHLAGGACAVGIALPFGQVEAATLGALVADAEACGAMAFAPAEGRALLALGLLPADSAPFRDRAADLGFIVRADDPRRAVIACPGAPACAAGLMPARAIAADIATAAAPILDGSVILHISGCAKGCAHPRAATLAFTGDAAGARLVVSGRAGDDAVATVPPGGLPTAVARLAAEISAARRSGECAADAIARLGATPLASAFLRETADA